jgi:hypothetical protein
MRLTIRPDDDLVARLEKIAADSARTLGDVIEDVLRTGLRTARRPGRARVVVPVFHGTGLRLGDNLRDSAALLESIEEPNAPP